MKLTQAAASRLKLPAGKSDYIEFDEDLHGFGLRLRSSGSRFWIVQYKIGDQHRRITLGSSAMLTADQARNGWKIRTVIGMMARQSFWQAQNKASTPLTNARRLGAMRQRRLAELLLITLRPSGPNFVSAAIRPLYHLNRLWSPLHSVALGTVNREIVASQIRAIAKRNGPVSANRARGTLSAMFRWAIGEGKCDANPVVGTNKLPENDPRDRTLVKVNEKKEIDWSELVTVWRATADSDYGRITKLLVLTDAGATKSADCVGLRLI